MYDSYWTTVLGNPGRRKLYRSFVSSQNERINAFVQLDPERGSQFNDQSRSGRDADAENGSRSEQESASERGAKREEHGGSGPLTGLPFAVKDNLAVEGFKLTCGSRMLAEFVSPYTATVVQKLVDAGARVVGKTNLDEFGMGSSTENSWFGPTRNPFDTELVAGGSSGGSAAAVAAGLVPFALGSDTGGSVRQPASFCGIFGLKPTYGAVSRFGLVAYASSLETVGAMARHPALLREVFEAMKGEDARDHSSISGESPGSRAGKARSGGGEGAHTAHTAERQTAKPQASATDRPLTVGVLAGDLELDPRVRTSFENTRRRLQELGMNETTVELPMLEYVVPVYYTIAAAEASANLARFDGVRYGHRPDYAENPDELIRKARNEGFGEEVKLRVLLGTYVLRSGFQDEYYIRAQKIRTAIRDDFTRVFQEVDLIMTPTYPVPPFPVGERDAFSQKLADLFTGAANLAGIPAVSIPASLEEGVPVGMQLMAPPFGEDVLFDAASRYADAYPPALPNAFAPLPQWLDEAGLTAEWRGTEGP